MKYLKLYEEINKPEIGPEIGDYVILVNLNKTFDTYLKKQIESQIGSIIKINNYLKHYTIEYKNITDKFNRKSFVFPKKYIKHWSKNKEDLEIILIANKYNL